MEFVDCVLSLSSHSLGSIEELGAGGGAWKSGMPFGGAQSRSLATS